MSDKHCKYLGKCGSCILDLPYEKQIEQKKAKISSKFADFYSDDIEFFSSKQSGYRIRAEFGLYHDKDELNYSMNGINQRYLKIDNCPKVDEKIANLMPKLLEKIKSSSELKYKVFGAEFITTNEEILVILLYHRDIEKIKEDLQKLKDELDINLIARSRGKKLVFGSEILHENLNINGKKYFYQFESNAFIQPNKEINQQMISWVLGSLKDTKDLFEMYCGYGNFTIPLSFKFNKVLANEISKSAINNALKNCEKNGVKNISFVRMSSEEIISAFSGQEFNRLKDVNLSEYNFSHILVDPPRAGLEQSVTEFIKNYENIIYVSCNPDTLFENLQILTKTHKVIKFAIFDQFPHTNHAETVALLSKFEVVR